MDPQKQCSASQNPVCSKYPELEKRLPLPLLSSTTLKDAEAYLQRVHQLGAIPVFYTDSAYPALLKEIPDAPPILFFKGETTQYDHILAIVGTRKASNHGLKVVDEIVEGLSGTNTLIVSGLAYGIDIKAHLAAIRYGLPTLAGHGLRT